MRLSFDIGGTFTDLVLLDEHSGSTYLGKTLTTYDDLARAVTEGIVTLLGDAGVAPSAVESSVIGATTLVTNALIERRGAPAALITTRGFADLIEIGREMRYDIYDLRLRLPEPLVPRELRFEITERMRADGAVETPVVLDELDEIVAGLRAAGVESVAICLLNSYVSGEHEAVIARRLASLAPEMLVTISSELAPEIREYERIVTSVANAYVRPVAGRHLDDIERAIGATGVRPPLRLMQSNGGITDVEVAARFPIRLLESGPAAGALGAAYWARRMSISRLMAFDMGGTTAKICLIDDGRPTLARTFEAARTVRHKAGSGLPVRVPVVELLEIGAGGGSIASIDDVGLLAVGPESAASTPGPACYGRDGTRPTVTDADLVLGYLDPGYFLGGRMTLDREAAERAISAELGTAFDGDLVAAAVGIVTVVEENMASAMRIHAAEHGCDPRDYTLFAFGGAAPVHAARVARRIGISRVVVPAAAGVLAASGLHVAPPTIDVSRTQITPISRWDGAVAEHICRELLARALAQLGPLTGASVRTAVSVDMRFRNQGYEIEVELPELTSCIASGAAVPADGGEPDRLFRERYAQLRGSVPPAAEAEIVGWRLSVTGEWEEPHIALRADSEVDIEQSGAVARTAWFESAGLVSVPIAGYLTLRAGDTFDGPVIVQQPESTVVVGPGDRVTVDDDGNLHIAIAAGAGS